MSAEKSVGLDSFEADARLKLSEPSDIEGVRPSGEKRPDVKFLFSGEIGALLGWISND